MLTKPCNQETLAKVGGGASKKKRRKRKKKMEKRKQNGGRLKKKIRLDLLPRNGRKNMDPTRDVLIPRDLAVDVPQQALRERPLLLRAAQVRRDVRDWNFRGSVGVVDATHRRILDLGVGHEQGLELGGRDLLAVYGNLGQQEHPCRQASYWIVFFLFFFSTYTPLPCCVWGGVEFRGRG